MAQIRTTSSGNYAKYNIFVEKMILESMKDGKAVQHGAKKTKYVIKNTKENENKLKEYLKTVSTKSKYALNEIKLETTDGNFINFGSLEKPRYRQISNRGDVAEGVFAAALFARFLSKTKKINIKDVEAVLKHAKKSPLKRKSKTVEFSLVKESPNKIPQINDIVELNVALAESNMQSLLDDTAWGALSDIFQSSVKYANSKNVKKWAELLYNNKQKNLIENVSAGTKNQNGTKVDVYVKIDKKNVVINSSLKAGDVKQFGQVGGTDFDKLYELWKMLGIDIRKLEKAYYKELQKDVVKAFNIIYNYASKQKINANDFISFVEHHATLKEDGVTLVQLSRNVKIYKFSLLKDKLSKSEKIETFLKRDSKGKPTLYFTLNGSNLLRIRMKTENTKKGVYVRTYIEKEKMLDNLIAEVL